MTHGSMITFRFNGLSRPFVGIAQYISGRGDASWQNGGKAREYSGEAEGMQGESKRPSRERMREVTGSGTGWPVNVQAPMQHNDTAKWFDHYRANITCSTELLCRAVARNIWHRY